MNNNNEQGSAGTPQERAAVPKGFVLVPIVAGLDEFTDRSIRDHADFREDVEILSTESNRKRLKIIRKDIYDTIDARVRHAVTAALAAAQPTPSKEGEQVGGAQATPLKNTRLDILSEIEDVLRAVYDDAASAHRFRAQGGNTQGESVAPTPSGSASVDTLEFRKLLNAAFAHRGVEGSKETVGNLIAHIESLIAAHVAGVRKDAERWRFMMRIADNDQGPEAQAMERLQLGRDPVESDRLASVQMEELIDAAMAAHSPATGSKEGE